MKTRFLVVCVCMVVLVGAMAAGDAGAQDRNRAFGYHGFGPRVGFSINPDQVFVGGHIDFGEAFPHVRFQPNIEIGFGDDVTVVQADADFHYRFLESWDVWNPYLGGGAGLASVSVNNGGGSNSDLELHIVGGIEKYISSGKFFVESKVDVSDNAPDLKFLAGWTFFR